MVGSRRPSKQNTACSALYKMCSALYAEGEGKQSRTEEDAVSDTGKTTIDFNDLADKIADALDIDYRAARDGLATYIGQVEDIDGKTIDRDAISSDDAEFLLEAYRRGMDAAGL